MQLSANTPPLITGINDASPLHDFGVVVGMVADVLTLEDGTVLHEMDGPKLTAALKENMESEGRTIRFINPVAIKMILASLLEKEEEKQEEQQEGGNPKDEEVFGMYIGPDEIEIVVPSGSICVDFIGQPPKITKINWDCLCAEEGVVVGMVVDTITIDDQVHYELDTSTLTTLLENSADSENRKIRFIA